MCLVICPIQKVWEELIFCALQKKENEHEAEHNHSSKTGLALGERSFEP